MTAPLNAAQLPLLGVHLIEASAGTGKTFTVANLYLRLLIDDQGRVPLNVEQILVVTFTKAATEELRARVRARIADALAVLAGKQTEDQTLRDVLDCQHDVDITRARLELAYQSMDQAAVFTIHGFCERVLREMAFESGELFDAELQAEDSALARLATEAWWRSTVTPMPRDAFEAVPAAWGSPGALLDRLRSVLSDPSGRVEPAVSEADVEGNVAARDTAWSGFCDQWRESGESWAEAVSAAAASRQISKAKGKYTAEGILLFVEAAHALAEAEAVPAELPAIVAMLGNNRLLVEQGKGKTAPQSSLGACIDDLFQADALVRVQAAANLQGEARDAISRDLLQRKQAARERTFDDLLQQLHTALFGESGNRLVALLRARYPVALIDEFQDTNRVQYDIFNCLYPKTADPTRALYLIGDPKQSIYRFRGADIDMYLRARGNTDGQHHLNVNWRSASRLVAATNALYGQSEAPFGAIDIQYQTVTAGGRADETTLTVSGQAVPPLQFDFSQVLTDKLPGVDDTQSHLARTCARRITWLLGGGDVKLGDSRVRSSDIAVLVWTHAQAESIRRALMAEGISSAMQSRENVVHSAEALDVLALLKALAQPGDTASLSRVLVSPLGGLSSDELLRTRDDVVAWQTVESAVERCRAQYEIAGPLAAVLRFMALFKTRERAGGHAGALARGVERVLGNYLHLADVLQEEWQAQPDPRVLLQRIQTWRENPGASERLQLRLENDEELVQIVTLHKSKGLQYPVVMLPFACVGRSSSGRMRDYVAYNENGEPRIDVGSERLAERRKAEAVAENEESLRLLYVALTRAEQGCWIGTVLNKRCDTAALFHVLGISNAFKGSVEAVQDALRSRLDTLASICPDIGISDALTDEQRLGDVQVPDNKSVAARAANRIVRSSWRVGSYSGLARGATHAERPDHDAVDVPTKSLAALSYNSPFHFPRGAAPGTLVHAVFERVDFQQPDGVELDDLVAQQLRAHGMAVEWAPALTTLVRNTLNTPLAEAGIALCGLSRRDRLDELAFHFPVAALDAPALVELLQSAGVLQPEDALQFETLQGYMTGFIDLVFRHNGRWFIADYKSNHLGNTLTDYNDLALDQAMRQHRYDLQYLIYSVALCRYLKARQPGFDPARHFGGAYYLFVRGMSGTKAGDSETGVYFNKPDLRLLTALDALFGQDAVNA